MSYQKNGCCDWELNSSVPEKEIHKTKFTTRQEGPLNIGSLVEYLKSRVHAPDIAPEPGFLAFGSCSNRVIDGWIYIWVDGQEPCILESTMSLEKIPAILLVGYGIHMSMTVPTPWTPKNERRGDGPVEVNWFGIFLKVSNFAASQTHQLTY